MIFATHTLGCKVNQIEIEKITDDLVKSGYTYTEDKNVADFLIINTCTVTQKSDFKSLKTIRRYSRFDNLQKIFVTGCYSELEEDLGRKIDSRNVLVSQRNKMMIPEIVEKTLSDHYGFDQKYLSGRNKWEAYKNSRVYAGALRNQQDSFFSHKRAFIKIQDGCNYFCSYCRIPFARGAPVSREADDIFDQVTRLDEKRVPEIVLSGINLGTYYDQKQAIGFGELLKRLLDGLKYSKIRISSIEPYSLDHSFYEQLKHPNLVPHIHLALQGTTDRILKLMNRRYKLSEFKQILDQFYRLNTNFSISTDVIVGFDDESEEEFEQGVDFVRGCEFSKIHVFPFSFRPFTEMEEKIKTGKLFLKNCVDESIKKERTRRMRIVSDELTEKFVKKIGKTHQYFIVEEEVKIMEDSLDFISNTELNLDIGDRVFKGTTEYYLKGHLIVKKNDSFINGDRLKVRLLAQKEKFLLFSLV